CNGTVRRRGGDVEANEQRSLKEASVRTLRIPILTPLFMNAKIDSLLPRNIRWWLVVLIVALAAAGMGAVVAFKNGPSPDAIAAAEANLPDIRHVRSLSAPHENISPLPELSRFYQSGAWRLTWSPDGQRLATYVHFGLGIIVW